MYKYVSVNEFVPHDDCIHLLKKEIFKILRYVSLLSNYSDLAFIILKGLSGTMS